ncbi:flagellar protein FlaG [Thermocrinis sp.]
MRVDRVNQSVDYKELSLSNQQVQAGLEGSLRKIQREVKEQVEEIQRERQEERRVSSEELQRLLEEIRKKFDMLSKYLKIDIDQDLEIPVVKIMERETNKVIRQIPPDYLLELMKRIDQLLGLLVEREV